MKTNQLLNQVNSSVYSTNAWIVEYLSSHYVAFSQNSCYEIIPFPSYSAILGGTIFSYGVFDWRGLWLPLIDLQGYVNNSSPQSISEYCMIVSFLNSDGSTSFAGISLPQLPEIVDVADDSLCAFPAGFDWSKISQSCFLFKGSRIPIIDLSLLFY